jgi:surface polysaccharide O-acyltransferase-like enzyme
MDKTRIEWIDFVRIIAILTVLYMHATDGIFLLSPGPTVDYTIYSKIFNFASLFIGRLGVPIFLMITGYLLLDRSYDDSKTQNFWKENCKDLIIITIIWIAIYLVSLKFLTSENNIFNLTQAGNLFFSHMWYMPMIIGMYLSLPFVASAFKHFETETIYQASIVFSVLAFVIPFISIILEMNRISLGTLQYNLGFSGGAYGLYIIFGYLVRKEMFKKFSSKKLWAVFIISFLFSILFQYYAFTINYDFILWYEFPFILLGSLSLFELCSRLKSFRFYSDIKILSKYAFAVFLIHNLFRLPLLPFVVRLPYSEPVKTIILWILLVVLSFVAAALIHRIPKFGKYILYME